MVFTSFDFLIFFTALSLIYFNISIKYRWKLLLISSLFFYSLIKPIFVFILLFISVTTFFFTKLLDKKNDDKTKFVIFFVAILTVISPLFFFKYYNLFNTIIVTFFKIENLKNYIPDNSLIFPIGISFYTFMSVGYIVDVYNEKMKAEKNLFIVMLFISFFPLVLSGPIERAEKMFYQFRNKLSFDYKKIVNGFQLILWGVFLKVVLADNLSLYLNPIFENSNLNDGKTLLLAMLMYPFQIYGDLGGYSLIAIGVSNILGIDIRINFRRPFLSNSMSNFWRRWHISLITWITDYIYTPISFYLRKKKLTGIIISLMITFLIAGLWHEASISFIIWGLIQGFVLSFEAITKSYRFNIQKKLSLTKNIFFNVFCSILVYLIFVFSLIFGGPFNSLSESLMVLKKIILSQGSFPIFNLDFLKLILLILMIVVLEFKQEFFSKKIKFFRNNNIYIRWVSYISIILLITLLGVFKNNNFIYFQF